MKTLDLPPPAHVAMTTDTQGVVSSVLEPSDDPFQGAVYEPSDPRNRCPAWMRLSKVRRGSVQ